MTNFIYNESPDLQEARLREKQSKCHHDSFRCSECHLYKDNVLSDEAIKIVILEKMLRNYEHLLMGVGVFIIPYDTLCQEGIIEYEMKKERENMTAKLYRHSE